MSKEQQKFITENLYASKNEIQQLLGKLIYEFNKLENEYNNLIVALLHKSSWKIEFLVSKLRFIQKIEIIGGILDEGLKAHINENYNPLAIENVLKASHEVNVLRNSYIHSHYWEDPFFGDINHRDIKFPKKSHAYLDHKEVDAQELFDLIEKIIDLGVHTERITCIVHQYFEKQDDEVSKNTALSQ
jgi:hypothetical protein